MLPPVAFRGKRKFSWLCYGCDITLSLYPSRGATTPDLEFSTVFHSLNYTPPHPIFPQIPVIPTGLTNIYQDMCHNMACTFSTGIKSFYWVFSHDLRAVWLFVSLIFNPDFYITRNTFSKIVQKIASR